MTAAASRPPSVERLLAAVRRTAGPREHDALVAAARDEIGAERSLLAGGAAARSLDALAGAVLARLAGFEAGLPRIVNATGVLLHTNLGRAAWPEPAIRAAMAAARDPLFLELEPDSGRRGRRFRLAEDHLVALTGGADALVTNNCAAALVLAVGLAGRRGVLVSRGELVEIGGGVRIPEIVRRAGARLIEVGTTNRTRVTDFEEPLLAGRAGLVLRVHRSNFAMTGFVESPDPAVLAALAREHGAIVVDDLGSGALLDTARFGLPHEPTPAERLAAGADLVTFSGDKLVGGPQAGLVVGRADLVARLRRDPLARAMRPDKATLAAVAATLGLYRAGRARVEIPVWRQLAATPEALVARADALAARLGASAIRTEATVGGGCLPGATLPSAGVAIEGVRPDLLARALRAGDPGVLGRVENGRLVLDLRTVEPRDDDVLATAVEFGQGHGRGRHGPEHAPGPPMSIVVGTAGHIDHGKTTLLRALTGIDADRLPEERRRGMTIEVGYAHLALPDGDVIDFVDVPGHDRLVGNMLVGAGEIDAVLVVVAADDGPRAQTLEHLELLDALGLRHAVAAVTKVDAADLRRVADIAGEVAALLERTAFAGAPVIGVSGVTGEGLAPLRHALAALAARVRADGGRGDGGRAGGDAPADGGSTADEPAEGAPPARRHRRMALDRVFTVRGRGTVVTGTLRGGPLERGAILRLEPGGAAARARELQVRGAGVAQASPGRVAMNLAGIERAAVRRGDVLTDDPGVVATDRLLVALRPPAALLTRLARATGTPIHAGSVFQMHSGTGQVDAVVRRGRRDVDDLPGGERTALLRLAAPIAAAAGDRFVLRNAAVGETIAGGRILDPRPPTGAAWRRATPAGIRALATATTPAAAAAALVGLHGAQRTGAPGTDPSLPPGAAGVIAGPLLLAPSVAAAVDEEILDALDLSPTVPLAGLRTRAGRVIRRQASVDPADASAAAGARIEALVLAGRAARAGEVLRRPGSSPAVDIATAAAMDRLEAALDRPDPPGLAESARRTGCPPAGIRALDVAGRIVRAGDDLAWSSAAFDRLAAVAVGLATPGPLTPAALRDATGTSRRYVVALLEELGRRGILARTAAGHMRGPRAGAETPPGSPRHAAPPALAGSPAPEAAPPDTPAAR